MKNPFGGTKILVKTELELVRNKVDKQADKTEMQWGNEDRSEKASETQSQRDIRWYFVQVLGESGDCDHDKIVPPISET